MGLNDLTLEKLIGEINGYKEKMRSIYEDYGRASQELQERINVLGYNLNEHMKETKDQIANTPQRLLSLETKYVSGEVSEGEYRQQREEFKHLLERNLTSIEEIKSMITILSHIESRPLNAAEFKHAAVPTTPGTVTGEEWGRGVFVHDKPSPSLIAPPTSTQTVVAQGTGLRFNPETPAPSAADNSAPKPSPSPPQPQSVGSNWFTTNPQPVTTTEDLLPPPTVDSSTSDIASPSEIAITPSLPPVETIANEPASAPSLDASPITAYAADIAVPLVDIVESSPGDDALMVKVVDDVPEIDASSTVVSGDDSQIQALTAGTETPTGLPTGPDLAQVSLTPPTQFYGVVCPKCGADVPKPAKVWELKGGKSKKNVLIGLFQCQDCRVKFREALTREII